MTRFTSTFTWAPADRQTSFPAAARTDGCEPGMVADAAATPAYEGQGVYYAVTPIQAQTCGGTGVMVGGGGRSTLTRPYVLPGRTGPPPK